MKPTKSPSTSKPTDGSSQANQAWKSKDYGLGPEPPRGTPEWMEWIEDRAMLAGLAEAREEEAKERTQGG